MADPTIAQWGSDDTNTSTSAVTLTAPGVSGDLAVLVFRTNFDHDNGSPFSWRTPTVVPSGWEPLVNVQTGNIGVSRTTRTMIYTFWKLNDGNSVDVDVAAATGGVLAQDAVFLIGFSSATGVDTDTATQDSNASSWPTSAQNITVTKNDARVVSIIAAGAGTAPTLSTANSFTRNHDSSNPPVMAAADRAVDAGTIALPQWNGAGARRVEVAFTVINVPAPSGNTGIYVDGAVH